MPNVKTYPEPDKKVYSLNELDESLTYSYAHYLKNQTILVYTLNEMGRYEPSKVFALGEEVGSSVLLGFILNVDAAFED